MTGGKATLYLPENEMLKNHHWTKTAFGRELENRFVCLIFFLFWTQEANNSAVPFFQFSWPLSAMQNREKNRENALRIHLNYGALETMK